MLCAAIVSKFTIKSSPITFLSATTAIIITHFSIKRTYKLAVVCFVCWGPVVLLRNHFVSCFYLALFYATASFFYVLRFEPAVWPRLRRVLVRIDQLL